MKNSNKPSIEWQTGDRGHMDETDNYVPTHTRIVGVEYCCAGKVFRVTNDSTDSTPDVSMYCKECGSKYHTHILRGYSREHTPTKTEVILQTTREDPDYIRRRLLSAPSGEFKESTEQSEEPTSD